MIKDAVGLFGVAMILAVALGAIIALPIMWLWNGCLVDAISGVQTIGYLQAWGLYILASLMFKSSAKSK